MSGEKTVRQEAEPLLEARTLVRRQNLSEDPQERAFRNREEGAIINVMRQKRLMADPKPSIGFAAAGWATVNIVEDVVTLL